MALRLSIHKIDCQKVISHGSVVKRALRSSFLAADVLTGELVHHFVLAEINAGKWSLDIRESIQIPLGNDFGESMVHFNI